MGGYEGLPVFAGFDRSVPTEDEAKKIVEQKLGLSLTRLPKRGRDLAFLDWCDGLTALSITGGRLSDARRVSELAGLEWLTLLCRIAKPVDLSGLHALRVYEGYLDGCGSVLGLDSVQELYLKKVSAGALVRVPRALQTLSLAGVEGEVDLRVLSGAPGLRELVIDGAEALDVSSIPVLAQLRTLVFGDMSKLEHLESLERQPSLKELVLEGVAEAGERNAIERLRDSGVSVRVVEAELALRKE